MADQTKNFAYSLTTATVTAGATSFSVTAGHGSRFPATSGGAYNLVVYDPRYTDASKAYQGGACEIIRVTTLATDTFSVITRAQEGTTAIAWGANWRVEMNATSLNFSTLATDIATNTTAISAKADGFICTPVGSLGANATRYIVPVIGTINSSSASNKFYFPYACTLKNMCVSAGAVGMSAATNNITLRKGTGTGASSDTTITTGSISISTASQFSDLTHTVSVASGDWIEFGSVTGAGATYTPTIITIEVYKT